ncbi:MAG: alkaline phosphatase family protein, partial [Planctomycetaceae bacterium]|nr:alkaline phosphatase family protein [Planctomycetaceae bacterium]
MHRIFLVIVLALISVGTHSMQQLSAAEPSLEKHVIILSIDGLSASYLNDPKAKLPNLRKLMKIGAHAQGMETIFPSVTWPAHVSLVTGASPAKHGVINNSVLDRKTLEPIKYIGDPTFTKDQCVKVPTLYDVAHRQGMITAAIIWPATNGARTLDFAIPDSNRQEIHTKYTTPGLADELEKNNISIRNLGAWGWDHKVSAMRDSTYTDVAKYLFKQYEPHLIMMHFITPDGFEHDYGPHCEEAYWACENSDDRVGELWDAIQASPLKDNTTLIIVSDHGFAPVLQTINPNVLLRESGLITLDSKNKIETRRAWSDGGGGSAGIYILDEENKESIRKQLLASLAKVEGVDRVLDVKDFMKYGLPDPKDNPQQADIMISAKSGYAFSGNFTSETVVNPPSKTRRGTHGHLPDQPFMHATLIMAGAGIKPGAKIKIASSLDVAPT